MFIVNGLTARRGVHSCVWYLQPTRKNKVQRTYYNSLEIVKRFENTYLFKLFFFFLQG